MGARWPARVGRFLKRLGVTLAAIFFVALIAVLWAFRTGRAVEIARERIVREVRESCGVDTRFDALKLGLFPPEAHLTNVVLTSSGGGDLLSVEEAIVDLAVFPLFYGRIQLDKVALLAPRATIELQDGRISNLPHCLEPEPQEEEETPPVPIALGVRELLIERGRFHLRIPGELEARLDDIGVTLRPGSSGGSDLVVGVDDGALEFKGKSVPLGRLRLLSHIAGPLVSPRAIAIERLELEISGVELVSSGAVDLLGPVYEAQISLRAPLSAAAELVPDLPEMKGDVELTGQIAGTAAAPRATGRLVLKNGQIDVYRTGDETVLDFQLDREKVQLRSIGVKLADGTVAGTAELRFDEALSFDADLEVERMSLARVLDALDVPGAWADLDGTGKVTARGQVEPFKLGGRVDIDARNMRVFDRGWDRPEVRGPEGFNPAHVFLALGPTRVNGGWSADPEGIWFRDAVITRGTTTGTASARINFEDHLGLFATGRFDTFRFADIGAIAGVEFGGSGKLEAVVKGPYSAIGGKGRFEFADTTVGGVPFGQTKGTVDWRGTSLFFDGIEGRLRSSQYRGTAQVDFEPALSLHLSGAVTDGRLEDLLVPFAAAPEDWGHPKGAMTGTFDLSGPLEQLTGPVELTLAELVVLEERAERGTVTGRLERGALVFDSVEIFKKGARISASGRIDPNSGAIKGRVRTDDLTLQKIDALRAGTERLDGALELDLELTGNTKGAAGSITAELRGARAGELPIGGGKITGKIRGGTVELSGSLLDDALDVSGEIELKSGLPYRGALRLREYDATRLAGQLRGERRWTGLTDFRAELSGKLVEWRDSSGTIYLDRAGFDDRGGLRIELVSPAKLTLARGVLETKRLVLGGPDTRLVVVGKLGAELLDLKVQGRTDLGILETFFPSIERSGGVLTVNAVIRRNKQDLDLLGTGRVERGIVQWRGLPSRFSSIGAALTFSQATVLIDRLDARYAGGKISASGQVLLEGLRPSTVAIQANIDQIRPQFVYSKFDLEGLFSGKLFLEGRPERLNLRGELKAQRATFRPKFDWRSIIADPAARLTPSVYDPSKEVLHFGIAMKLDPDDPLRLRNDTAQVDLSGDLVLSGTNQRLGLLGSLTVGRGRVGFLGREYTVESGTLDFRDRYRFFPRFDLLLSARACDATIDLNLVGTLDEVSTSYSSKPEMEETNIVSCLIRGVKIKDLENIRGDRGSTGLSFAGEALWRLSGVDQQVRKVLPVDQIEVTTEYSTRERVYEPRILVAKELQDGKVRLEYSSSLVKNDDQRAAVRYRITPALTLQYGWTSSEDVTIGDHGLDLKYRWEW